MKITELVLFYFPSCPFCRKVLEYLDKNNIKVTLKNIHEDEDAREELKNKGGKVQVPCLFIDGQPLYESDEIIRWFENNY